MTATSSVDTGHASVAELKSTAATDGVGVVGAVASLPFRATSSKSKMLSALFRSLWWTSTAMVLSPAVKRLAGTWYSNQLLSAVPEVNELAGVLAVIAPAGRLSRTTGTPLT